jgi:hypothetical protein
MLVTVLVWIVLFVIAFGLRTPWSPRRAVTAAIGGLAAGLVLSYFNAYVGSVRGLLTLLGFALIVSGARFMRRPFQQGSQPLHRLMPAVGVALVVLLVAAGLFPFTSWGAKSVREPVYADLNANQVTESAPSLALASDVRVVPWDLASKILQRGYGEDASWLDSDPYLLQSNTYPDTVRGEFLWVHAPAPETSKWLIGGRQADKVLYVKNDASNLTPSLVQGTLNVHVNALFWQHRLQRHAQENGELRYVLEDVALQLDDDYQPHWIAYLTRMDLRGQLHLEKLLIVNAHTGDEQMYDPKDAPAWVELVYPEQYVYEWARYWGQHREGFLYRWFNAARLVEPDDVTVRYIRVENQTYWLLPMKQLRAANLGGYILINTRTGAATFYDRFDEQLVDYDTAHTQLQAIMASGEATRGAGQIRLTISEGYLYPVKMADGNVRDAYIFPLLEGLKVSRIAMIDAQDYNNRRVFAATVGDALAEFSRLTGGNVVPVTNETLARTLQVLEGTADSQKALVNLNGTWYRVTVVDLGGGQRLEADREMDELSIAIARAARDENVTVEVLLSGGRIVDVRLPGVQWGA